MRANSGNEDNGIFRRLPPVRGDAKLRGAHADCGDEGNGNVRSLNPQRETDFLFRGLPPLRRDAKLGVAFLSMKAISTVPPSDAAANVSNSMAFFAFTTAARARGVGAEREQLRQMRPPFFSSPPPRPALPTA